MLRKKAYATGVKSITLNERGRKFHSDIRTFRTVAVFCLKGRFGPSCIDRVKTEIVRSKLENPSPLSKSLKDKIKEEHARNTSLYLLPLAIILVTAHVVRA
ncbi:hypothetical protein AVEN_137380-1 [Araneus ventricosus]|uniref:Uncharacterized protein n=1 Tax=Araneus ventricosus TaxID=182803 RepID=A0A4Y2DYV5_ARAVE|nr:hypothetical protein AVEN_137380-1 [Araneus ventricosus]